MKMRSIDGEQEKGPLNTRNLPSKGHYKYGPQFPHMPRAEILTNPGIGGCKQLEVNQRRMECISPNFCTFESLISSGSVTQRNNPTH
jgi:hypothetical protein